MPRPPDYARSQWIGAPRDEANRKNAMANGIMAHTSGANADDLAVYKKLLPQGLAVARRAVDQRKINVYDGIFADPKNRPVFPMYLVPLDETGPEAWQVAPEEDRSWAQGVGPTAQKLYTQGSSWRRYTKVVDPQTKKAVLKDNGHELFRYDDWTAKWPGRSNPGELWAARKLGNDPNQMISVEFVQNLDEKTGSVPFTQSQHERGARLFADVARRHGFHDDLIAQGRLALSAGTMGWPPAMFSHSDSDPISRSNAKGSWDPGHMMDWELFWKLILQA